ncbi:ABC transporter permease subunit [Aeromonas dhakensis]|uniref:ABC transporter permease subunit n=1 Tax=Aeromonas dhakensis TaxID=196024 RepID=UPI0038CFC767
MSLTLSRPLDPARRIRLRWPLPRRLGISLLTLGALLVLWWLVARLELISPLFLPPPAQVLWYVIVPSALPDMLTGLRIGLGVGWSTLVAAELIAATRGVGFMVQAAGEFLATDVVLAGILVIALIAFTLELGLRALQRRLTPWHGEGL